MMTHIVEELKEMYKLHNHEFLVIRDGDTLDIGGKPHPGYGH